MIEFYAPEIETELCLPEEESGHCLRVLRHRAGDEIYAVDGKGHRFLCRLTDEHKKRVAVEIIKTTTIPTHWQGRIILAVAPTKNSDRIEWLTEKAVEIGVSEIVLLRCDRSERKGIKTERLRKIMVSAMKQSLKAELPIISEEVKVKDFLKGLPAGCNSFIAYCGEECERHLLSEKLFELSPDSDIALMTGPEGDFSPAEISAALEADVIPVSLGDTRLRTETATLFGLSQIHTIKQLKQK